VEKTWLRGALVNSLNPAKGVGVQLKVAVVQRDTKRVQLIAHSQLVIPNGSGSVTLADPAGFLVISVSVEKGGGTT